jgi:hypothetical protein
MDVHTCDDYGRALFDVYPNPCSSSLQRDLSGPHPSPIISPSAIISLDALEIALEDVTIEDLIVVNDARKHPEKSRARFRCQLLLDVAFIQSFVAADLE